MRVDLKIIDDTGHVTAWWLSFIKEVERDLPEYEVRPGPWWFKTLDVLRDKRLEEYGAMLVRGSQVGLHFTNKKMAIWFLLRWA